MSDLCIDFLDLLSLWIILLNYHVFTSSGVVYLL